MCTHRGIRIPVALGLYRNIRTLWYDKSTLGLWIGPVTLVIFVDTADSFAHGNSEQNNSEKNINDEI